MKKWIPRFLSVFLLLSIFLTSTSFAQCLPNSNVITSVSTNEVVLSDNDGHVISVLGEDLSNGDSRFFLLEDGEVISTSYVDRANLKIIWTKYQNGAVAKSNTRAYTPNVQSGLMTTSNTSDFTNVGTVRYRHYVQGMLMTINSINWAYHTNTSFNSTCNLNGYYQDIIDFAAAVIGLGAAVSTSGALTIVSSVLSILGTTGSVGEFFIPDYDISCTRYEVVWRATVGSKDRLYRGYRCVVNHPNGKEQIVIEGDYYPTTAIADHNSALAFAPYSYFFPGSDRYEIESWPK